LSPGDNGCEIDRIMKPVALKAVPRTLTRRGGVKKLRQQGRIPAILYGPRITPLNLELNAHEVETVVHHSPTENILLDLSVEGDSRSQRLALVQVIQHHPLSGRVLHVDLHEVNETEKVTIAVPVEALGEAAGVKAGGILEHVLFKLKVRALLKDLPDQIVVDVSHLEIGQAVHIGEITAPAGVEILGDKKISVLAVAAPAAEVVEVAPVEGEALAEPEVIREKKEEGEGEEEAPDAAAKTPAKPGEKTAEKAPAKEAEKKPEKKPEKKK
jgi:large subunit ribosomal protein L25